ncbi:MULTISPECIES: hypothetical protein [Streptomyces]|uniref:Uncharacterized protein n=1 Tax=Streptomyces canarius TaxID=285453 RepID=A0ABQ3DB32_9ACTN|nr:hypothetical protein [Streptomyces canarius]GHA66659.1 hypothetical protein GCM10010345_83080 [Streptomyces canarius]
MFPPPNGPSSEGLRRQARSVVAALGLDGTELAPDLVFSLLRAGFGVQTDARSARVEVRDCPEHYGAGSLLISWAPHEVAYTPLDPRVTRVESIMTDALLDTVRALGFRAERLGRPRGLTLPDRAPDAGPPARGAPAKPLGLNP